MKNKAIIKDFLKIYPDTYYIRLFQDWKEGKLTDQEFLPDFYSFLSSWSVMRSTDGKIEAAADILKVTKAWVNGQTPDDVMGLAHRIKQAGLSRGQVLVSLSSKVLHLNNPWKIFPYDNLAKKTLGYHGSDYNEYYNRVQSWIKANKHYTEAFLESVSDYTDSVEKHWRVRNMKKVRFNRAVDIILLDGNWSNKAA